MYLVRMCRANFAESGMDAPAKESRIALGALIIKERLGVTDEETVAQIREKPYLQYFLGLHEYLRKDLFDPSMMVHFLVHFRKRISPEALGEINLAIISRSRKESGPPQDPPAPPPSPILPI